MQRVCMSLPYFENFGWEAEVVTVQPDDTDMVQDDLLLQSIPATVKVHQVKAFNKKWTSKAGLGSVALRSLWFYRQKVNDLLKNSHYHLIYFSTTQFPVCILGAYWKKRFNTPYIIDLQDPWHSEYYQDKPKHQRSPKYWFSYRLNKYTEAIAMKSADGLISVSQPYIDDIRQRYAAARSLPARIITFGALDLDLQIAHANLSRFTSLLNPACKNIVYVGRGGADMHSALHIIFTALQQGLKNEPELFQPLRLTFIGTSYAPAGQGQPTLQPLAAAYGLADRVIEYTDRISYYHTLTTLLASDALVVPGSDAKGYTASKLYPYLSTQKPLLAILNEPGAAADVLDEFAAPYHYNFNTPAQAISGAYDFMLKVLQGALPEQRYNLQAIYKYSAEHMTEQQADFFNLVTQTDL